MALFFERFHLTKWVKTTIKNRHQKSFQSVATSAPSQSSETIVASVVEEMLDEFESTTPQTNATAPVTDSVLNEQEELDYLGLFDPFFFSY